MNTEFERFLKLVGGTVPAMEILGCSDSSVYKMRTGERSVTPKRAKVIVDRFPELSFLRLTLNSEAA